MVRVLVTGGAGFVGSHSVDRLVASGHSCAVIDSLDPQVHGGQPAVPAWLQVHLDSGKVEFFRADIRDREAVTRAMKDCDAILHLAAAVGIGQSMYQPRHYMDVNAGGTATILDVLANGSHVVRKLVVASTMSLYGEGAYRCATHGMKSPKLRRAEDLAAAKFEPRCDVCGNDLAPIPTPESKPLDPTSVYAIGKHSTEQLALVFGAAYGIPTVALRYFNIYGTRQSLSNPYTGVTAIFLSCLLNDRRPPMFEDGLQSRDFVHVSDVATANELALTRAEGDGRALNVGTGRALSVGAMAEQLAARLGKPLAPEVTARWRPGDVRHCTADISAIAAAYGYLPRVAYQDGLDELIAWSGAQRPHDTSAAAIEELAKRGLVR
jgi:dTDP-L-rhamnose 4-epimerase